MRKAEKNKGRKAENLTKKRVVISIRLLKAWNNCMTLHAGYGAYKHHLRFWHIQGAMRKIKKRKSKGGGVVAEWPKALLLREN